MAVLSRNIHAYIIKTEISLIKVINTTIQCLITLLHFQMYNRKLGKY